MSISPKGPAFSAQVDPFVRRMDSLNGHRETLSRLQGSWDTLALLGHLSSLQADMGKTRQAFDGLTGKLMATLAEETLERACSGLGYKAQVAIDILTRNLFERTADIGFLATDGHVVAGCSESQADLSARFATYVSCYSVYTDVVLLDPRGRVLSRLRPGFEGFSTSGAVAEARTSTAYVESYGINDFSGPRPALTYASAVRAPHGGVIGVLLLVFDLEGEAQRIFERLGGGDGVLALLDGDSRVVRSSDPDLLAAGRRVPPIGAVPTVRLGGVPYLAVQRRASPYQGYAGPGWSAVALVPVDVAFDAAMHHAGVSFTGEAIFSPELLAIPVEAAAIQRRLDRAVWNGQLQLASDPSNKFTRALLREIATAGGRTKGVFETATTELLDTVSATVLAEADMLAELGVDILDRNLFERACDCRWWAQDASLLSLDPVRSATVLRYINGLYTVYTDIVLFDANGVLVASSRGKLQPGDLVSGAWVRECLRVEGPLGYAVSAFGPEPLYDGERTYVYAAPLRVDGRLMGGIGLVFDAKPQFDAMLNAALPARAGAVAAYLRPDGAIISSSGPLPLGVPLQALALQPGQSWSGFVQHGAQCYAIAATAGSGYREFKTIDGYKEVVIGLVLVPCGTVRQAQVAPRAGLQPVDGGQEIACFYIGQELVGVASSEVVECVEVERSVRAGLVGGPTRHCGYMAWRDRMLPLLDLSGALGAGATDGQEVVVLANEGIHFGLLINGLGPIVELGVTKAPVPSKLPGNIDFVTHIAHSRGDLVALLSPASIVRMVAEKA